MKFEQKHFVCYRLILAAKFLRSHFQIEFALGVAVRAPAPSSPLAKMQCSAANSIWRPCHIRQRGPRPQLGALPICQVLLQHVPHRTFSLAYHFLKARLFPARSNLSPSLSLLSFLLLGYLICKTSVCQKKKKNWQSWNKFLFHGLCLCS